MYRMMSLLSSVDAELHRDIVNESYFDSINSLSLLFRMAKELTQRFSVSVGSLCYSHKSFFYQVDVFSLLQPPFFTSILFSFRRCHQNMGLIVLR